MGNNGVWGIVATLTSAEWEAHAVVRCIHQLCYLIVVVLVWSEQRNGRTIEFIETAATSRSAFKSRQKSVEALRVIE